LNLRFRFRDGGSLRISAQGDEGGAEDNEGNAGPAEGGDLFVEDVGAAKVVITKPRAVSGQMKLTSARDRRTRRVAK